MPAVRRGDGFEARRVCAFRFPEGTEKRIENMKCPNCGVELVGSVAEKKCPRCHYNLVTGVVEEPKPVAAEEPPQAPAPAAPAPAPGEINPGTLEQIAKNVKSIAFWVKFWSFLAIAGGVATGIILALS